MNIKDNETSINLKDEEIARELERKIRIAYHELSKFMQDKPALIYMVAVRQWLHMMDSKESQLSDLAEEISKAIDSTFYN